MYPVILGMDSYIIMAVLGFAAAFAVARARRKAFNYAPLDLDAMLLVCIMGLLIGAKLLFVITMIPEIIDNFGWDIIKRRVLDGGLVFYGGLFGALFCLALLAKRMKRSTTEMLNFAIPCYAAFHIFGRIGCLLDGCCYGKPADWGVHMNGEDFTRIPIQLIEAAGIAVILTFLLWLEIRGSKKGFVPKLVPLYFLLYGILRFTDEIWRGDILRGVTEVRFYYYTAHGDADINFTISTSQVISLILIVGTLVWMLHRYLKYKKLSALFSDPVTPAPEKADA